MKVILKKKDIELLSLDLAVRSIYFTFQDWANTYKPKVLGRNFIVF